MGYYFDKAFENWLPEDDKPLIAGYCNICDEPLLIGEDVLYWEDNYYCSITCLLDAIGFEVRKMEGEDDDDHAIL